MNWQEIELPAKVVIRDLKREGRWLAGFDELGLPMIFSELSKSKDVGTIEDGGTARPIDLLTNLIRAAVKPNSAAVSNVIENSRKLHDLAQQRAKDKGMSYGDALSEVARENPEISAPVRVIFTESGQRIVNGGVTVDERSDKLHALAKQRAKDQNVSYGEALSQVAKENPEVMGAAHEQQVMDRTRVSNIRAKLAGAELDKLATERQKQKGIKYSDALQEILDEHPELS